jgi:putative transposase
MSIRKEEFINGEIYHITVRGVDGRKIFIDDEDRWRGIFSLYEFNTKKSVVIRDQREKRQNMKKLQPKGLAFGASAALGSMDDKRLRLVDIFAFVFMPNHIHLLLRQLELMGVSLFMQKLGSGYSGYFNSRYGRKGHLFQGKFTARNISGDEDLKNVLTYIHTNPLSLFDTGWKDKGVKDCDRAKEFLMSYRWSSYLDYSGVKNFPSITERDFLIKIFGGAENIKNHIDLWIENKKNSV